MKNFTKKLYSYTPILIVKDFALYYYCMHILIILNLHVNELI